MISPLSQSSPLQRSAPVRPPYAQAKPDAPSDRVELSAPAEARVRKKSSKWKTALLATTMGVSVAASLGAMTSPGQALVQQILHPQFQVQDMVGQLHGYSGELATDRGAVIQGLQQNIDQFDSANGHQDGKIGVSDLERVAADSGASAAARDSAQAVLADPVLMNSLDVATGTKVDHVISLADLNQAWENEQGGDFGSFASVRRDLLTEYDGQSAFQYFDQLGSQNDKFDLDDLRTAAEASSTPVEFRDLAENLLANPNYINAFDVASNTNPTGIFSFVHGSNYKDGTVSAADLDQIANSPSPEVGAQFSSEDQAALDRLLSGEAPLSGDLIQSFQQRDRGNCASTALIKAAMHEFGPQVFQSVEKLPDGSYTVTMRDGFRENISPGELEAAATATHYAGGSSETKSLATLSYASMAKRAFAMGHEGAQTYGQALLSLNDGEVAGNVPLYLGLEHHVDFIRVDQVREHDHAVVSGNGHAYFVEKQGDQYIGDKWGDPTVYQGRVHIDEGARQDHAYILTP
ncbi:MAG: hypothetical protein J0I12_32900 [Candidatus Eremiobacteraeota bacterium]|nr:hypothetical protein [Candidatus Eremiobacteraeota bacterium]